MYGLKGCSKENREGSAGWSNRVKLTADQWKFVKEFIPEKEFQRDRGGQWRDPKTVLEGIFWILETGAQWKHLPAEFGSYKTVHRRYQNWVRQGVFEQILHALADDLVERGGMDIGQSFIDGHFVPAKKGARWSATPSAARGASSWQWRTARVFLSPPGLKALRRMK